MSNWSQTITIDYVVQLTDCFLFVNNTSNCTITFPSATSPASGYVVKLVSNVVNTFVTFKTDSNTCFIDGSNTLNISTLYESVEIIMGDDGNYWTVG